MQVLRAFRCERAPVTNAELVRRTGLSKATVSRLTSTLMQLGFVRHVAGGRAFELAAGALGIGHTYLATNELIKRANPFLQELADRLNVSVALAVGEGRDILYIGYRVGQRVATLRLGVGSVLPIGTTAIGRAYIWAMPAAEQKRLIADLKRVAGPQASLTERGIKESFAELEQTGTCAVLGGYQRNAYGVALPVRLGRKRILMSLSCGKVVVREDLRAEKNRIDPVLKTAAVEFEQLLVDFDGQL
ncbi:MAG: IclR family transcriptional regulator [Variovorax sp.]|nr:MAG: IclR family transcriptional regulator [Variovorax sp.]